MEKTGIAKMTPEMYEDMYRESPQNLITFYLMESGFAGINRQGTFVDRRIYPDAQPLQPGGISIAPTPKAVVSEIPQQFFFVYFKQYSIDSVREAVIKATDETEAEEKLRRDYPQACSIRFAHGSLELIE